MIDNRLLPMMNHYALYVILAVVSFNIDAATWFGTEELQLRHDIELLTNSNIINIPRTTWPIPRKDLELALNNIDADALDIYHNIAYLRIKRKLKVKGGVRHSQNANVHVATENQVFRRFGDDRRDDLAVQTSLNFDGERLSAKLQSTLALDPIDDNHLRLDGSYLVTSFHNWTLGIGLVERWWGPGWESSLILTNNARPRPGFLIQRERSTAFESKWLSWAGPWQLTAFFELLDDDRVIKNAKLFGLSISFKPLNSLEIGLRRTAQWGGEGRVESLNTFWDMLTGQDNCNLDIPGDCDDRSQEAGNQLAAIDLKYKLPFLENSSFYMQLVGEDEAKYFPSKKSYLFGIEWYKSLEKKLLNVRLEVEDTTTDSIEKFDVLYEHSIYKSGYRYKQVSLGSTLDNDSTAFTLSLNIEPVYDGSLTINLRNIILNENGDRPEVSFNSITANRKSFDQLAVKWRVNTYHFGISIQDDIDTKKDNLGNISLFFSYQFY